jgi:Peptidase family M1 domain
MNSLKILGLLVLAALILLILASTGSCTTFASLPEQQLFDGNWDDLRIYEACLIDEEKSSLQLLQDATVYHLDLAMSADLMSLTGREQVHYTNRETVELGEICFRLFPNVSGGRTTISSVSVDTVPASFDTESNVSVLSVVLPEQLKPGDAVTLEINFTVDIPQSPSGNYGLFGYFGNILALDSFYPVIPVYDNTGWHIELGPPYGDKTFYDASFYMVRVTAPANLVLVASGSEVKKEIKNEEQIVTFAAGPARDFYLVASSRFTRQSAVVGQTTINNYTIPEITNYTELVLTAAKDSLESFNARFGEYPYKELDIVALNIEGKASGVEYPGVFGLNVNMFTQTVVLEATVAHEVGHQWFYNVIGNDQVNEPWLDEALAQYITGLYYLDRYGTEGWFGFRQSWITSWERINQQKIPIGLPVIAYQANEYSPIVYGRGPLFIEVLADKIGEQAFNSCLRQYYQSNKWQVVTAVSFQEHFQACTTFDLNGLFEEWVLP